MLIKRALVADPPTLSVTLIVKLADPAAEGAPLIWPAVLRAKPAGSAPVEIDHEYGGVPPLAPKLWE